MCRFTILLLHAAVARSNDLRVVMTCDLFTELMEIIGPLEATTLNFCLFGTKTVTVSKVHSEGA
jgi:hypothetical protein